MGHSRLCEYQAGLWKTRESTSELVAGCQNVKEAKSWIDRGDGQGYAKVTLWPQTAKAKRFLAGRGDYIEVTKDATRFVAIS